MFDFVAAAKYNAWKGKAGMSSNDAMNAYIAFAEQLIAQQ